MGGENCLERVAGHERKSEHAPPRSSDGLKFFDALTDRYLQFRDHHSHRTSSQIITITPGIQPYPSRNRSFEKGGLPDAVCD
jgi:hypothetical protein